MAQHDQIAAARRVFLDHDEISAFGDRRAGKDAHGLTGFDDPVKAVASRCFADNLEHGVGFDLGTVQGIAVHR